MTLANNNRTYGIEVEFIGDRARAAQAIRAAGIECECQQYGHAVPRNWKIVTDASVGYDTGGELVSPILRGEDGLRQVTTVLAALRSAGCTINRSCGLHVHVGVADLNIDEMSRAFVRYKQCEAQIDSIMPRSRRLNDNRYVCTLQNYNFNQLAIRAPHELESAMGRFRHLKLNFMSYARQKTIEFRHHGGSLNTDKVINWIKFCVNFIEQSRDPANESARVFVGNRPLAQRSTQRGRNTDADGTCFQVPTYGQTRYVRNCRLVPGVYSERKLADMLRLTDSQVSQAVANLRSFGYEFHRGFPVNGTTYYLLTSYNNTQNTSRDTLLSENDNENKDLRKILGYLTKFLHTRSVSTTPLRYESLGTFSSSSRVWRMIEQQFSSRNPESMIFHLKRVGNQVHACTTRQTFGSDEIFNMTYWVAERFSSYRMVRNTPWSLQANRAQTPQPVTTLDSNQVAVYNPMQEVMNNPFYGLPATITTFYQERRMELE